MSDPRLLLTGLFDNIEEASAIVGGLIEQSIEDHPVLWVVGFVVFLLLMIRGKK